MSLAVAAAVFLSFLAYAAVRCPVPGVNEPYYLSKARHFWNPDWCRGDLFLESGDAHFAFYALFGWPTRWLTLEQTAWLGRSASLLLLAVGWTALVSRLLPDRWASLWAAWIYLALASIGSLAGEWIVGGVEAKVFAYAFVLAAAGLVCAMRYNRAALCAGLAVSVHPVVGMWSLACGGFARAIELVARRARNQRVLSSRSIWKITLSLGLFTLAALPGLMPALMLLGQGSAAESAQADAVQVLFRLAHHMNPREFSPSAYAGYAALLCVWLIGLWASRHNPRGVLFHRFVLGAVLVFAAGLLIGLPPRWEPDALYPLRLKLLKFYPFRLADAMLPVATAVVILGWALSRLSAELDLLPGRQHAVGLDVPSGRQQAVGLGMPFRRQRAVGLGFSAAYGFSRLARRHGRVCCWIVSGLAMAFALLYPSVDRNPSRMSSRRLADWKAACSWIAANTPSDSVFLTPSESWAFKWYAQRAEYVSFKDFPQDAPSIVEWRRRLNWINRWRQEHEQDGVSLAELQRLHEETGVTHIILQSPPTIASHPVYENQTYCVYRLSPRMDGPSDR